MSEPTGITPDTKDWTWVLQRRCDQCGFDAPAVPETAIGERIRQSLPRWRAVLGGERIAERPAADRWSALEYAAHVSDVFALFDGRLALILDQDDPELPNWDQDAAAAGYRDLAPQHVAAALDERGTTLADHFDAVGAGAWDRTGRRSDGYRFTVRTLGRYLLHDVFHHLDDVSG